MTIPLLAQIESRRTNLVHTLAKCWLVDGTQQSYRFTDHDSPLTLAPPNDQEPFTPAGGFTDSATQSEVQLVGPNKEIVGVFSVSGITTEGVAARLFNGREVTEYLVDWRYPWIGPFMTTRWWISEVSFDEESWSAQLEGIGRWLRASFGHFYNDLCDNDLFDEYCLVDRQGNAPLGHAYDTGNLSAFQTVGALGSTALDPRLRWAVNGLDAWPVAWFDHGFVEFTSGANAGLTVPIKRNINDGGEGIVEVQHPLGADVVPGDLAVYVAGCEKSEIVCKSNKFENFTRWQGYFMPGQDRILQIEA